MDELSFDKEASFSMSKRENNTTEEIKSTYLQNIMTLMIIKNNISKLKSIINKKIAINFCFMKHQIFSKEVKDKINEEIVISSKALITNEITKKLKFLKNRFEIFIHKSLLFKFKLWKEIIIKDKLNSKLESEVIGNLEKKYSKKISLIEANIQTLNENLIDFNQQIEIVNNNKAELSSNLAILEETISNKNKILKKGTSSIKKLIGELNTKEEYKDQYLEAKKKLTDLDSK